MAKSARTAAIQDVTRQRLTAFIFFSIFMLFAAESALFAAGGMEADIIKADTLISEREYDKAISLLSDFARRHPDKFDLAQRRLRIIILLREDFNRAADELIHTLLNDPENNEKILELTRQLHTLEKADSPLLANYLSRTMEIAQFNVNRKRLLDIMERARDFLDKGECNSAVMVYAEGMDFMRDEFYTSGYGANVENEIRRETERMNTVIASFQQRSSQMGTVSADMIRALNAGDTARINEITSRITVAMDSFIALKQEMHTVNNIFTRTLNQIRTNDPEIIDRNHLSFMQVIINGRHDENAPEGILGSFDTYWNNSIGSVTSAITQYIQSANSASLSAFNAGNYQSAASSLNRTEIYANLSPLYFEKHRQLFTSSAQTITLFSNNILRNDIAPFLEIRSLSAANASLLQASNAGVNMNISHSARTLNEELQTRNSIVAMRNTINSIRINANQTNAQIAVHHRAPYITDALAAIEKLSSTLQIEELQSAQRYYTIAHNNIQQSLASRRSELERGRNFLNGESRTSANGIITIFRYPSEALGELTAMLSAVNIDLQNGNSIMEQHRSEAAAFSSNASIASSRTGQQNVINELSAIRAQGMALAETARSRSAQAEAYRQDGERLLREAQAAFQRQSYDLARERIQRASDRFNESLEIQESASLRQIRDTQLINLGQQINIAENENIIVEVRNLVNAARTSYFNGDFQQAEDSLTRARNRWRLTNPDENEEIIYWMGIVRTAMSANSGRNIPATAPLYAEMSQLLSQAQRNFEEGVRFVNAGQRASGIAKFDEARSLTREVRLMFPVNQEAGILELRIEQFLDPTAFNSSFEQRLRNAVAGTRARSIEAFADLQNLAELNPRYPNMRSILTQAEIDMGYRPPPPNPANIARSRELTAAASRIVESNTRAQYEVALAQLNEAITLNPENTEATRVRDRLLSRMSVPGNLVLSSEDEADYQRALRELQAGNNLVALTLVERLMQNPSNRNITKLIELQQRILSAL
ncbi:MAG: hypothetical protein FWB77_00945 [Treponema sp.]|nr:hypothetical protein [Treponema sp.]